ncbi:hypothetical protein Tco_0211434 [Tanacetum coccineum]
MVVLQRRQPWALSSTRKGCNVLEASVIVPLLSIMYHRKHKIGDFTPFGHLSKWKDKKRKIHPKTEKSSMKTSMFSQSYAVKECNHHLWNMPGAFITQRATTIANVPSGQVKGSLALGSSGS